MPVFPVDLNFLNNCQGETMGSEKKTFRGGLRKLIFGIIVTLLFSRSLTFCKGADDFDDLYHETNRSFARAHLPEEFTIEILNKHEQTLSLPSPLASVEPNTILSVPVPPVGVTVAVFTAAMFVGWLRRRTPDNTP
jgi:hypothetical protein